ncbi:MAG: class I SAM-dependent methyltransferase [Acidiferrobacterales bacterium]
MSNEAQTIDTKPAEIYETHLVAAIFDPWARELIDLAAPQPGESVLDVACGTGIVARLAAECVTSSGYVAGLDMDPAMLAVAASRNPSIEWYEGSADELPFNDDTFDLAVCQQGLQFFPDRLAALEEMRRALNSEGRLVLNVWRTIEYCPGHRALSDAMARHVDPGAAKLPPFSLGDREELRSLVTTAGFQNVVIRPMTKISRFPSPQKFVEWTISGGSIATRRVLAQVGDEMRDVFTDDVCDSLRDYVDDEGFNYPMQSHLLVARS